MAVLSPTIKMQFLKANGDPLANGKLYSYESGTTTPLSTYTDSSGITANTNPIILDSRGEANIWLSGAIYKFRLTDVNDVEIWTADYISAPTSGVSPALSGNVTVNNNSTEPALKITQTGSGLALQVQDSTDPDLTSTVIDSQGRLGVGTIAPSELVDVSGGNVAFTSGGGTLYAKVTPSALLTDVAADSTRALTFSTNSSERLRVTDTGLVGIGKTPSAGVKLDVSGDIATSTLLKTDTISELTPAAGVTVAGVLFKNNLVTGSARPILTGTAQNSTSGSSIAFHNLPSYVKRITVLFNGVSLSGADNFLVQLGTGTSGSPVWISSNYVSNSFIFVSGLGSFNSTSTSAFLLYLLSNSTYTLSGIVEIDLVSSGVWASTHTLNFSNSYVTGSGVLTGAGTITQLQVTRTGSNTFDAGSINIFYE